MRFTRDEHIARSLLLLTALVLIGVILLHHNSTSRRIVVFEVHRDFKAEFEKLANNNPSTYPGIHLRKHPSERDLWIAHLPFELNEARIEARKLFFVGELRKLVRTKVSCLRGTEILIHEGTKNAPVEVNDEWSDEAIDLLSNKTKPETNNAPRQEPPGDARSGQ